MDEVGLGQALQDARQRAGLTQQELCQKADLSYSTLAKIERGAIKAPSIFTIQSIAGALNTTLNELLYDVLPQPSEAPVKLRSKSGIQFVYFDINGCLVHFFQRAFTELASDISASPEVIESTFWHYNDAVCRGELPMDEFNTVFAQKLGITSLDWRKYYLHAIDPIHVMQELLTWASEYYHVGLLSNIMPGFIEAMIEQSILPDLPYTAIIDSSVVGAIKPESDIYLAAQEAAPCPVGDILLIDDSRANLMAAERMGWRVLWCDAYRPEGSAERARTMLEPPA